MLTNYVSMIAYIGLKKSYSYSKNNWNISLLKDLLLVKKLLSVKDNCNIVNIKKESPGD